MKTWTQPIPYALVPSQGSEDFRTMPEGTTGIPVGNEHPGAFGHVRRNHVHEGVDLYCEDGTVVRAVEDGTIVAIIPFTGGHASPPSPWWRDTWAVLIEGGTGVVVYGEVAPYGEVGDTVLSGWTVGHVAQVLTKNKGRPMSMLHLELHVHGTRDAYEWTEASGRPDSLLDPTPHLLDAIPQVEA